MMVFETLQSMVSLEWDLRREKKIENPKTESLGLLQMMSRMISEPSCPIIHSRFLGKLTVSGTGKRTEILRLRVQIGIVDWVDFMDAPNPSTTK